MPRFIWTLLPAKKQPITHQYRDNDGSLEMQVPLTIRSDKNETPSHTHPRTMSILGLPQRVAEKYLGPRFTGWRFGVLHFAVWASVVFLINLIVMIWGMVATSGAKGVFYDGDCDRVKKLNTGLHLLINIFSTILLAGSNYTMQCLSAPTRREIDSAHSRQPGMYLDIGVPGIRNIGYISRRRAVLWVVLGLSSLPLHLL